MIGWLDMESYDKKTSEKRPKTIFMEITSLSNFLLKPFFLFSCSFIIVQFRIEVSIKPRNLLTLLKLDVTDSQRINGFSYNEVHFLVYFIYCLSYVTWVRTCNKGSALIPCKLFYFSTWNILIWLPIKVKVKPTEC